MKLEINKPRQLMLVMNQNELNIFGLLLSVFMVTCVLVSILGCSSPLCCNGCVPSPGLQDFSTRLPGGYVFARNNTRDKYIIAPHKEGSYSRVNEGIEPTVTKLAHDESYIIAERYSDPEEYWQVYHEDELNVAKFEYYIINHVSHEVWGPYSKDEFKKARIKLEVDKNLILVDSESYDQDPNCPGPYEG